jgi:hypothetical protein
MDPRRRCWKCNAAYTWAHIACQACHARVCRVHIASTGFWRPRGWPLTPSGILAGWRLTTIGFTVCTVAESGFADQHETMQAQQQAAYVLSLQH